MEGGEQRGPLTMLSKCSNNRKIFSSGGSFAFRPNVHSHTNPPSLPPSSRPPFAPIIFAPQLGTALPAPVASKQEGREGGKEGGRGGWE